MEPGDRFTKYVPAKRKWWQFWKAHKVKRTFIVTDCFLARMEDE